MGYRKGIAHLLLIVIITVAVLAIPIVIAKFVFHKQIGFGKKAPNVALRSEYANPFKKDTQYVNPFDETKNPFINVKK